MRSSPLKSYILISTTFTLLFLYLYHSHARSTPTVDLVIAALESDNTTWLTTTFTPPYYAHHIYTTDALSTLPSNRHAVPANKGHEAMAYLTHIITAYDHLAPYTIFHHGTRYQWHNEDPLYDAIPILKNLQLSYLSTHGFATLRCTWWFGCPAELHPLSPTNTSDDRYHTEMAFAPALSQILPSLTPVPKTIGVHCGGQFAVTRERIRKRPRDEYIRMREWLLRTSLDDAISGRIMEYAWHLIMGMEAVVCPSAERCFCEKFGLCDLDCPEEGGCRGRYWLNYGVLPEQWPEVGGGTDGWPPTYWAGNI